jgi:hypothetical protein
MVTSSDIAQVIERLDAMSERCDRLIRKELVPIRPDHSYPCVKRPDVEAEPAQVSRPSRSPVDREPQERFDEMNREGFKDYRPLGRGGFGDDVDQAFEECANAPW